MKSKYTIALFFGLFISACTADFEEINKNPNNPATTEPVYVFNYVLKEGAGEFGIVTSYNYTYIQRWVMQTAAVWGNSTMPPYTLFDQYRIQLLWEHYYANVLLNCVVLEEMTAEDTMDVNRHQVARIWKVYNMHKVTDLWGDVPYSDAWRMLNEYSEEAFKPKYDRQEDIYTDMLNELKDAATKIDPLKPFYSSDLLFNGKLNLWVKFANSLRLRLAMRSGNQPVINEILNENNLISSESESAVFTYIESQSWWNPYYETWLSSKESTPKISWLLKEKFDATNDPRLPIYAQPAEFDGVTYQGVPNLMDANKKENQAMGMGVFSTSYIGTTFVNNPQRKKPLLSYAEVCFIRAEAAQRGWTGESAQTWYEEGVRASMSFYGLETAAINEFLTNGDPFNNTLEQIMEQKWIALFLDGWEAYNDYRRTGYPQLKKWDLTLDGIKILQANWVDVPREYVPGRLRYPENEMELNGTNYLDAVDEMGGDSYYQQVWWAKEFGTVNYEE
ncbi:MAG: SusD/RagB family nutrient-binding outer membrane lipoprotein [Salinivirgaceae bacterium]